MESCFEAGEDVCRCFCGTREYIFSLDCNFMHCVWDQECSSRNKVQIQKSFWKEMKRNCMSTGWLSIRVAVNSSKMASLTSLIGFCCDSISTLATHFAAIRCEIDKHNWFCLCWTEMETLLGKFDAISASSSFRKKIFKNSLKVNFLLNFNEIFSTHYELSQQIVFYFQMRKD